MTTLDFGKPIISAITEHNSELALPLSGGAWSWNSSLFRHSLYPENLDCLELGCTIISRIIPESDSFTAPDKFVCSAIRSKPEFFGDVINEGNIRLLLLLKQIVYHVVQVVLSIIVYNLNIISAIEDSKSAELVQLESGIKSIKVQV
jgi:hypothetical protein